MLHNVLCWVMLASQTESECGDKAIGTRGRERGGVGRERNARLYELAESNMPRVPISSNPTQIVTTF